jgi:hypothetical protein
MVMFLLFRSLFLWNNSGIFRLYGGSDHAAIRAKNRHYRQPDKA